MLILKVFNWNMRRSSVSKMRIIIKRTIPIKSVSYIKPPSEWNIQVVTKHENFLGLHRIRFWWIESLCKRFSRLPCPKGYLNPFRASESFWACFIGYQATHHRRNNNRITSDMWEMTPLAAVERPSVASQWARKRNVFDTAYESVRSGLTSSCDFADSNSKNSQCALFFFSNFFFLKDRSLLCYI